MKKYVSEIRKWPHPRSLKFLEILANYRGASVGINAAEAFFIERKLNE